MVNAPAPRTLVVNFNSPELNQLALALVNVEALAAYVRPYANKSRLWEQTLSELPLLGDVYDATFGRRRLDDPRLAGLTREAGVLPDLLAAAVGRLKLLPAGTRHRWANQLHMSVREAVAGEACRHVADAACVVGYEGFALPAFETARAHSPCRLVLDYPVAHHRHRRRMRLDENEREPEFAVTWPDFDDWPAGHEERLDEEIRLADAVLVGSTYAADSFVAEGVERSKMHVVPYGVDLQTFRPAPPESAPRADADDAFRVIYAGQLTQRKGLSYLLRGYQQFARADSQLTLVGSIVGSDAPLRPFAGLIEHVPHQTRAALAQRYRASDVFVLPTLVEGMPLVVLEAMACGLPVIVTANGPGDLVRDGVEGFVIPERDPHALADRLERLHLDPKLRLLMGQRAAARARTYSWDAYARKALRVLSPPPAAGARRGFPAV